MREAFNEMVREKNALKVRTKTTVTGPAKNSLLSSGEEDSDDSDESSGDDKVKARQTAISQIEQELQDMNEEDSSVEESDDEGEIKVSFKKQPLKGKSKEEDKGIMGLKFMKRAELNKKEQLKVQAKMLIDQIKEE